MDIRQIEKTIKSVVVGRVNYFDVIIMWLATDDPIFKDLIQQYPVEEGESEDAPKFKFAVKQHDRKMSLYKPEYRQRVTFHLVKDEDIDKIIDILNKNKCGYLITRIEIAFDWITRTTEDADLIHKIFAEHFVHKSQMNYVYNDVNGASYFADMKKDKLIPVMYSDRMKTTDQPCAHFEYRLASTKVCKSKFIRTFSDVKSLNIVDYMKANATFCKKPPKQEIGKSIIKSSNLSARAYQKKVKQLFDEKGLKYEKMTTQAIFARCAALPDQLNKSNSYRQKAKEFSDKFADIFFGGEL